MSYSKSFGVRPDFWARLGSAAAVYLTGGNVVSMAIVGDSIRILRGETLAYVRLRDLVEARLIRHLDADPYRSEAAAELVLKTRAQGRFRVDENTEGFRDVFDACADLCVLRH